MKHHDSLLIGRRSFLAAAAAASVAGTADQPAITGHVAQPGALSRSGHRRPRRPLQEVQDRQHGGSSAGHRHPLGRGPGLERRRPLPALERHSQQSARTARRHEDGHVSTFRSPVGNSNGNTFDFEGRQLSCEHGTRRVVRYEHNGKVSVLADKFDGKPLDAPNDIIVHPDGGIWFTDPGYGILMEYEGHKAEMQLKEAVYRIDPKSGKMTKLLDDMFKPNGLCFLAGLQESVRRRHRGVALRERRTAQHHGLRHHRRPKVAKGREFASMEYKGKAGFADGIRADTDGNIWAACGWVGDGYDGVHVFTPNGKRIGLVLLPEIPSNVCFGGAKRNRLFITASQSLYAVYVEARGARRLKWVLPLAA